MYETKQSSEEENPVHRQNTTLNVDKIRSFRPLYVWMKIFVFFHGLTVYQWCVVFCTLSTGTPVIGTAVVHWKVREEYKEILHWAEVAKRPDIKRDFPGIGQIENRIIAKGYVAYSNSHPWIENTATIRFLCLIFGAPFLLGGIVTQIWYRTKPLVFRCPHCNAYMPSTMGWICQSCGHAHADGKQYAHSYMRKCAKCKETPASIACPRCHNVIALTEGVTVPTPVPNPAGGRIRVQFHDNGETGMIDANDFDPATMRKL